MHNTIINVVFNNEPPTERDYKYFMVILKNGDMQTFHYHKNNPIPTRDEMIGLTWDELIELAKKKFYESIEGR